MAKKIDALTSRSEDYSKWYNELVVKADLAENSEVRGCMVIKPYGYAIWEKMQAVLDGMFKRLDMSMLTSRSLSLSRSSLRRQTTWRASRRSALW